jgi:acetyl-CoA acetyltransferase
MGKPMRKVAIVGGATTKMRPRHIDKTYFELAYEAVKEALAHAAINKEEIESCVYGIYNDLFERQFMPDFFVHDYLGMGLKPGVRVTTGGATGGSAIREGFCQVASGLYDVVLVAGCEKCSDCFNYEVGKESPELLQVLRYAADMTWESPTGRTAATVFALPIIAHQALYGGQPTEEQMAKVSVKNHGHATKNPKAHSPMKLTVEQVMKSPMICYPFKFYDNCLYSEGAAALILASEDKAKEITDRPVWITGIGASLDYASMGNRYMDDPKAIAEFRSSIVAADVAYKMAGVKNPPKEIDFAELHDAFTGTEIMAYEDCGFCSKGEGGRLVDEGVVWLGGELPVNPSGGLLGMGHPVGATGIMQTVEAMLQLREEAGERQVKNARRGLVQSIGAVGCAWTVAIVMERGE